MKKTAIAVAVILASVPSLAAQTLEFDDVFIFGGTLTYSGDPGAPLVGTDIKYDLVTGVGTTPSGPLTIIGGELDFTTGPNLSEGAVFHTFAGGGTFTLSGTVIKPDLSVVASGILLSGSFSGTSIVLGLGGGSGLFAGVGIDAKNPDLLAYYGIDPSTPFDFANTEIGFVATGLEADGGFVASVIDADLTNTAIPESGSMLAVLTLGTLVLLRLGQRNRTLSSSI